MTLQANLLRKFLAYNAESLAEIDESRLLMAMSRDVTDLVTFAFCRIAPLVAIVTRLFYLFAYRIMVPIFYQKAHFDIPLFVERAAPTLLFPVVMALFLLFRNP